MKKVSILILFTLIASGMVRAQEYKIRAGSGKVLKLYEINKVEIEGYDGSEIIFSTSSNNGRNSERAEGLTAISGMGLTDNSGIGLSVVESGNDINVNPISKRSSKRFTIKVPAGVKIFYEHSTSYGSTFKIRNVSSEIEASTNHSGLLLEDVSGPMTINTVHGKIEAKFSSVNQSSPISIISVHGLIDVALPANTNANLKIGTGWGEIYTDMDIKFDQSQKEMRSSTKVSGTLNGGGVAINMSTSHSNIYLRTRK